MTRYTLTQTYPKSCGGAASAVARAEINHTAPPTNTDEDLIFQQISRNYGNKDVSAPAKIVRYFKDAGFRASLIESPFRTAVITASAFKIFAAEWTEYSSELWSWTNWITRWPRGVRERDFDNDARLIMLCMTPDGMHYLLVRREGAQYYVMDPAFGTDSIQPSFTSWAGLFWADSRCWDPRETITTGSGGQTRDNHYLGISIWINSPNAPYVYY